MSVAWLAMGSAVLSTSVLAQTPPGPEFIDIVHAFQAGQPGPFRSVDDIRRGVDCISAAAMFGPLARDAREPVADVSRPVTPEFVYLGKGAGGAFVKLSRIDLTDLAGRVVPAYGLNNRDLYLQFCGAIFAEGAADSARLLLHAYRTVHWWRQDYPFDGQHALVAGLPRGLFEDSIYQPRHLSAGRTTDLAAGRKAIAPGLIDHPDPRVRLEMLEIIHGTVLDTSKTPSFFQHVLPDVLARQDAEDVAMVTEQVDAAVEAFIIKGLVQAEVAGLRIAAQLEPLIRRQIARDINPPLNRSRLIEVLIHLGREAEAQGKIEAFKADFGTRYMLPGLCANRDVPTNIDAEVVAMRQRAAELT